MPDTFADGIATLVVGRPEKANALREQDKADLAARIRAAAAEADAIVLTGRPSRAFCAGSDIDEMSTFGAVRMRRMLESELAVYRAIMEVPVPVVGMVNGAARGAGAIIALCCDQVVAAEDATFGFPELTIGVSIPLHGFLLPLMVGLGHARSLYYRGEPLTAADAGRFGIANEVVPGEQLEEHAQQRARGLASIEGGAFAIQKRLLNEQLLGRLIDAVVDTSLAESSIPFETRGPGERMRRVRGA